VRDKPERLPVSQGINHVWSMDFMRDQLEDGRTFRLFNVIDDFNVSNGMDAPTYTAS
jgi:putative transposase